MGCLWGGGVVGGGGGDVRFASWIVWWGDAIWGYFSNRSRDNMVIEGVCFLSLRFSPVFFSLFFPLLFFFKVVFWVILVG